MNEFKIVVENSAPSQAKPAKSVDWACNIIKANANSSVVDFGCGRLRNLSVLNKYFNQVVLVDTKLQCERIKNNNLNLGKNVLLNVDAYKKTRKKYDIIFLICVLHTIPQPEERESILHLIHSKLKKKGVLVVDVPQGENYYRQKMTEDNKYLDGYVFGTGTIKTFYKKFFSAEVDDFITKDNRFELSMKKYFDKHIVRIYRKCDINAITE